MAPERILCVDDDVRFLDMLRMSLTFYGFEVITAGQGIEAVTQYRAHAGEFAVILTDHHMPKMSGLELVKELRAVGYAGRVVLMSGHVTSTELMDYRDLQISGFLRKPFEISLLVTLLRETRIQRRTFLMALPEILEEDLERIKSEQRAEQKRRWAQMSEEERNKLIKKLLPAGEEDPRPFLGCEKM